MVVRFRPWVALLLVAALGVGCTPPEKASSGTTTSSTTPRQFATPRVGECRGVISREIIRAPSDIRAPVSCGEPHGSETIFVGRLPAEVAEGPHSRVDALTDRSPELRSVLAECDEEYRGYVGVSRIGDDAVRETNVARAFFIPPVDEWAGGARWIRCDAVTEPSSGQVTRGTTESLRGILARESIPPAWRACYRNVAPPPKLTFDFFVSCDQPHAAEALLRFRTTDPMIEDLAEKPAALEEYARTAFNQECTNRVAGHLGLTATALAGRTDVTVGLVPVQIVRWPVEREMRWVQCLAFTNRLTVGTLEGLGNQPLPRP